jgi:hypothetical protein
MVITGGKAIGTIGFEREETGKKMSQRAAIVPSLKHSQRNARGKIYGSERGGYAQDVVTA